MNPLVAQLIHAIPASIVCIVGLVLALTKWSRHPQASLLVTAGVSVLLVAMLCSTAFYGLIAPQIIAARGHASAAWVYGVAGLVFTLLHQTGILLLILGAFANRKPQAPPGR
jgi:hypothetical protein